MPVHHQKSDSWEMDSDLSPSCKLGDLSRGSSSDSRTSSARSRSLTLVSNRFCSAPCARIRADSVPPSGLSDGILSGVTSVMFWNTCFVRRLFGVYLFGCAQSRVLAKAVMTWRAPCLKVAARPGQGTAASQGR